MQDQYSTSGVILLRTIDRVLLLYYRETKTFVDGYTTEYVTHIGSATPTDGYLPSRSASDPFGRYEINL